MAFRERMVFRHSLVLRAKREIDFTRIRSTRPLRQSASSRGVDIRHRPASVAGDEIGVVTGLRHEGVELVAGVGTDPAVGRYPQLLGFRPLCRLDDDDFPFLQRRAALSFVPAHGVHLLSAVYITTPCF